MKGSRGEAIKVLCLLPGLFLYSMGLNIQYIHIHVRPIQTNGCNCCFTFRGCTHAIQ